MPDLASAEASEPYWVYLDAEHEPGQFVFDYFNADQLVDVAQSLGLDLAQSRQLTREERRTGDGKFSIKVVEVGTGTQQSAAESATHAGALPTLMLIEILAELKRQARLHPIAGPRVDGPSGMIAACRDAASRRGWAIIDGEWTVSAEPLTLRLVRPTGARSDPGENELVIQAAVPAIDGELTATGRVRLTPGSRIEANVFAHIERWSEDDRSLTVIAHAAFARVGDPRFEWRGASFGDNSNGDF